MRFKRRVRSVGIVAASLAVMLSARIGSSGNVHQVGLSFTSMPSALSSSTLLEFERNGHVATRGLLKPQHLKHVADRLWSVAEVERNAAEQHAAEFTNDDSPPFLQTFNPHRRHAIARELAMSPVLAATAAALLGVACVRLYQDCLFWKRPGDDYTEWHADLWTAPLATNDAVTVWLPLHRVDVEGGPLYFQTRSHRDLMSFQHSGELESYGHGDFLPPGQSGTHHAPLEVGDATWHHGWTVHGASAIEVPPSDAGRGRLAYTATYFADGALALYTATQMEDIPSYEDWLSQVDPGTPAEHELLPIAYRQPAA